MNPFSTQFHDDDAGMDDGITRYWSAAAILSGRLPEKAAAISLAVNCELRQACLRSIHDELCSTRQNF